MRTEVWYFPTCQGNGPWSGLEVLCQAAYTCPTTNEVRFWRFVRTVDAASGQVIRDWRQSGELCQREPPPNQVGAPDVAGEVLRAWRRLPLPTPQLRLQPPNGRTIVNFDTIFYTDTPAPGPFDLTLLGARVQVRATPTYVWSHGDGTTQTTTTPGAPYPRKDVVHRYQQPGPVQPTLTVVYRGQYSVAGGPWLPIAEPVTLAGPPVALQVMEARAELVAG